jgi:hypothetical protein
MSPLPIEREDSSRVDWQADARLKSPSETVGEKAVSDDVAREKESMARVLLIEDDQETADESGPNSVIAALSLIGQRTASKVWIRRVPAQPKL